MPATYYIHTATMEGGRPYYFTYRYMPHLKTFLSQTLHTVYSVMLS